MARDGDRQELEEQDEREFEPGGFGGAEPVADQEQQDPQGHRLAEGVGTTIHVGELERAQGRYEDEEAAAGHD